MAKQLTIDRPHLEFDGKALVEIFEARGHAVKQVSQNLGSGAITIETVGDLDVAAQNLITADVDLKRNRRDWR